MFTKPLKGIMSRVKMCNDSWTLLVTPSQISRLSLCLANFVFVDMVFVIVMSLEWYLSVVCDFSNLLTIDLIQHLFRCHIIRCINLELCRMIEEWVTKNQADEVYMLAHQINALIKCLELAKDVFPLSYASLQGLALSSLAR